MRFKMVHFELKNGKSNVGQFHVCYIFTSNLKASLDHVVWKSSEVKGITNTIIVKQVVTKSVTLAIHVQQLINQINCSQLAKLKESIPLMLNHSRVTFVIKKVYKFHF